MDRDNPLSAEMTVLVDTNVFLTIGRPSNPKFIQFRRVVRRVGLILKLPRRVVSELGGTEADRVKTALNEDWAEIIDAPPPTDRDAMAASDIVRRTIASETDLAEHEVEKTDTVLAGLAVQYVKDHTTDGVIVLTDDKPAEEGIDNAAAALGYTDVISVYGVKDILGDDPGDTLRLV